MKTVRSLPHPADFAAPPGPADLARWAEADREARPRRLDRLRERLAEADLQAYFGLRPEHSRYLTGFSLAAGEEKVAGNSGQFLVAPDSLVVFADSRYTIQAGREAPEARVEPVYHDLAGRWRSLLESVGARRVAVEADVLSHASWTELQAAAPDVELVPAGPWLAADRAVKEPAEVERIGAACTVADRALAAMVRRIRACQTERELALGLEWEMRTGGADGLAFDVACLGGPEAALPHGSPGDREVCSGAVLLFDFGAQVAGYRSDMTRTLFVGEPRPRDLELYDLVERAQSAAIARIEAAAQGRAPIPTGREADAAARDVIEAAGLGERFGHGTGHGIGLATHEQPSLSRTAPETPLPSPTVFSVEPGVYLEGETGVRIEDLLFFDAAAGRAERLTHFPREVLVVGV